VTVSLWTECHSFVLYLKMDQKILVQFGRRLQEVRTDRGMSQEKLAESAHLDRTYISLLERGKRNPSFLCVISLCRALDIELFEFFETLKFSSFD
jgi:transcriptional regulator with XRE-family HTH domain